MDAITLFEIAIGFLLLGSVVTFVLGKQRQLVGSVSTLFAVLAALAIFGAIYQIFAQEAVKTIPALWQVPGIGAGLSFKIDFLSALFLAIIAMIAVLVTLYSIRYMQLPTFANINMRAFYPVLLIFFASVMCVVTVSDMFFFFIFWELMTLSSYVLVVGNKHDPVRARAGFKYFLITHIATSLLFIAAILLYRVSNSFSFTSMANAMTILATSRPGLLHLILAFFLLGFATKAGILPMGDWLPDAYPAAPTPATVAFAGSMTKLGIYGIVRVFCDFLPISGHTQTWGLIIAVLGTISIFIGTMTALVQENAKRLLSFHVIGQMGYMFLGIGIGVSMLTSQPVLALVGIGAGVFHLINNVLYKSCLFLNSGSVFWKVGTHDLNKVGGLSRILPLTAVLTVIASLSIAGIPPFNGFASKWLIYQCAIQGGIRSPLLIAMGILAIFISAVTLASFVKFFSATFYGKYADNNTKAVKGDVPLTMMIPQVILAFLCVVVGVFPLLTVKWVYTSIIGLFDASLMPSLTEIYGASKIGGMSLDLGLGVTAVWSPVVIIWVGLLCFAIAFSLYRAGGAPRRVDSTWYCGELHSDEEVRYNAHSYYLPFKQFFRIRIGKYERTGVYPTINYPKLKFKDSNFIKRLSNIDHYFYYPVVKRFLIIMKWFSASHSGIPQFYLLWAIIGVFLAIFILFMLSATGA